MGRDKLDPTNDLPPPSRRPGTSLNHLLVVFLTEGYRVRRSRLPRPGECHPLCASPLWESRFGTEDPVGASKKFGVEDIDLSPTPLLERTHSVTTSSTSTSDSQSKTAAFLVWTGTTPRE